MAKLRITPNPGCYGGVKAGSWNVSILGLFVRLHATNLYPFYRDIFIGLLCHAPAIQLSGKVNTDSSVITHQREARPLHQATIKKIEIR